MIQGIRINLEHQATNFLVFLLQMIFTASTVTRMLNYVSESKQNITFEYSTQMVVLFV